jgi:hypothetical protein
MKKALALLVCVLFVLSTNSFALWGIGEKKAPTEVKGTTHAKEMGKGKKLGIIKKETKAEKEKKAKEKKAKEKKAKEKKAKETKVKK